MLNQAIAHKLLEVGGLVAQRGSAIHYILDQMKTVQIVAYRHIEWCRRATFLFVAPHMQIRVVGATIGQPVDQPGIAVVGKDDRLIGSKQ